MNLIFHLILEKDNIILSRDHNYSQYSILFCMVNYKLFCIANYKCKEIFKTDTSLSLLKSQNKINCFYFNKYTYIPGSLLDSIHIDSIQEYEQLRLYQRAPEVWPHPSFAQGELLPHALMFSIYPVISNQNYIKSVLIRIVVRKKQNKDLSYLQISKSPVISMK